MVIIGRFRNIPCISPIVRFSTGLQILRQKLDEWNSVAHKGNNLRDLEHDLAEYVHRWMRMNLQHWRECLGKSLEKAQTYSFRFVIMLFDTVNEIFLHERNRGKISFGLNDEIDSLIIEMDNQFLDMYKKFETLFKDFMESSSYAQFSIRLDVLKAMELYIAHQTFEEAERKERLLSILYNSHAYYRQFEPTVKQKLEDIRRPIEKKIKDYVKIESFNKDLSYFSMKHNISRVHRNLHKLIKEYENGIKICVAELFAYKETASSVTGPAKNQSKQSYFLEPIEFVSSLELPLDPNKELLVAVADDTEIGYSIQNSPLHLFGRSKILVKKTVNSTKYSSLLLDVEDTIKDQIDTSYHLRKLEVDRTQERKAQKSEAKHILSQKRRALTEFFKFLSVLGINYRSGIHRQQLKPELVDLQLLPFTFEHLRKNLTHESIDLSIETLADNLETKYFSCVFKLKLLLKAMQSPKDDLGPVNLERIRGYSAELFAQVQTQRKTLAKRAYEVHKLREIYKKCESLRGTDDPRDEQEVIWSRNKQGLVQVVQFIDQVLLLYKVAPNEMASHHSTFKENIAVSKTSTTYHSYVQNLKELQAKCENLLKRNSSVVNTKECDDVLREVRLVLPRNHLLTHMNVKISCNDFFRNESNETVDDDTISEDTFSESILQPHISKDLADLTLLMLLPIQDLYKKYKQSSKDETHNENDENQIKENHLTEKLQSELRSDMKTLKPQRVLAKLNEIIAKVDDRYNTRTQTISRVLQMLPIFDQYLRFYEFFLLQLLATHKLSVRLLHGMLTTFLELTAKGFCVPPDLLGDEEPDQQEKGDGQQNAGGFSMDNGEGEKDVSDK